MIGKHKEQHKTDVLLEANTSNSSNVSQDLESGEEPPTKFTCPSVLKTFTTEHSLSTHIYLIVAPETYCPRKWEGSDVKCKLKTLGPLFQTSARPYSKHWRMTHEAGAIVWCRGAYLWNRGA